MEIFFFIITKGLTASLGIFFILQSIDQFIIIEGHEDYNNLSIDQRGLISKSQSIITAIMSLFIIDILLYVCFYFNRVFNIGKFMNLKLLKVLTIRSSKIQLDSESNLEMSMQSNSDLKPKEVYTNFEKLDE